MNIRWVDTSGIKVAAPEGVAERLMRAGLAAEDFTIGSLLESGDDVLRDMGQSLLGMLEDAEQRSVTIGSYFIDDHLTDPNNWFMCDPD